jgi:hypothetical protein
MTDYIHYPDPIVNTFSITYLLSSSIDLLVLSTTNTSEILDTEISTTINTTSHFTSPKYRPMKLPIKNDNRFLGPDLRSEIDYLTRSSFRWMGLRSIDYTKKCSCGSVCNRCMQSGYLFTDYLIKSYKWKDVLGVLFNAQPLTLSTQRENIVIRHSKTVNKRDFILELDSNPNTGILIQPLKIIRVYQVQDVAPMIGDDSRREFWKCSIEERNIDGGRPQDRGTGYTYKTNRDSELL